MKQVQNCADQQHQIHHCLMHPIPGSMREIGKNKIMAVNQIEILVVKIFKIGRL
jgi:hypothetical protein